MSTNSKIDVILINFKIINNIDIHVYELIYPLGLLTYAQITSARCHDFS